MANSTNIDVTSSWAEIVVGSPAVGGTFAAQNTSKHEIAYAETSSASAPTEDLHILYPGQWVNVAGVSYFYVKKRDGVGDSVTVKLCVTSG